MAVFVIGKYGERLMPTTCYGKVRHMLQDGRAVIMKHEPFTIQLTYDSPSLQDTGPSGGNDNPPL